MSSPQLPMTDVSGKEAADPESAPLQPGPTSNQEPSRKRVLLQRFFRCLVAHILVVWVMVEYINPALRDLIQGPFDDESQIEVDRLLDLPSDVEVRDCIGWTSLQKGWTKTVATTLIDLPINSESLFFLRKGFPIGGTFNVVQGDSISDNVHVDVVLTTRSGQSVEETRVCHLGREADGNGVGILADYIPHRSDTSVKITVTLPLTLSVDGRLALKNFESNLPYIRQIFSLNDNVSFKHLKIEGEYAPIFAENIVSTYADLKTTHASISGAVNASERLTMSTSNAQISGQFTSEQYLSAETSNAPISGGFSSSGTVALITSNSKIDAQVELFHDGIAERSTMLQMDTSNGSIEATVNATSLAPNGLGGIFGISSQTSNASNSLTIPKIPPQARVDITATTTLSPVTVELNEAWEGDYQIQVGASETADISVKGSPDVEDPEGRGRERHWHVSEVGTRGSFNGHVWWGEDYGSGSEKGSIWMRTLFAKAKLLL